MLAAVEGIPRRQPILDELLELNRLSERVRRVQDVIVARFSDIAHRVKGVTGVALAVFETPDPATLGEWQRLLNAEAQRDAGATYTTYLRSKISGVVDALAATACRACDYPAASNHAFLVRAATRCWAEDASLFVNSPGPTTAQIEFLRDFDLGYGIRRLQFVVAGINWWYACVDEPGYPTRDQLDALKTRLWRAIEDLRAVQSGERFPESLAADVEACFPVVEVARYIRDHGFDGKDYAHRKRSEIAQLSASLKGF